MNRVSATYLKNKAADILNEVIFTGSDVVVERYGKPIVRITPIASNGNRRRIDLKKALDESFGSLPDFPDVTRFRRSRLKKIPALI